MKCKFNGRQVDVLWLSGPEVYGVVDGLLEAVGVEEGEFPDAGKVYFYQDSGDDEERLAETYEYVASLARERGYENVPSMDDIAEKEGCIAFSARYEIVSPSESEYAMRFINVTPLKKVYELSDTLWFVEQGSEMGLTDVEVIDPVAMEGETIDERRTHWRDFIIPVPPPPKNSSDEVFLTLAYAPYDDIECGAKRTEYRDYTAHWVKMLLSHPIRTVKFQRGYGGRGHAEPDQMVWTVEKIWLMESWTGAKCEPQNIPDGFLPAVIAIDLGERVEGEWVVNAT